MTLFNSIELSAKKTRGLFLRYKYSIYACTKNVVITDVFIFPRRKCCTSSFYFLFSRRTSTCSQTSHSVSFFLSLFFSFFRERYNFFPLHFQEYSTPDASLLQYNTTVYICIIRVYGDLFLWLMRMMATGGWKMIFIINIFSLNIYVLLFLILSIVPWITPTLRVFYGNPYKEQTRRCLMWWCPHC
jgi:hypothetical protein